VAAGINRLNAHIRRKRTNGLRAFAREMKSNHTLYLMMVPGTVLVFLFSYLPMAGVLIAFKDLKFGGGIFKSFANSKWVGLRNFEFLFKGDIAMQATRNTILYNLAFIVLGLVLAVALAVVLNEIRSKRLSKFYQTSFLLPYFLSWIIVAYFTYGLLNAQNGMVNKAILEPLNLQPVDWYFKAQYWPFILVFLGIWKYLGYNTIIYTAAMATINEDLYESAEIDGANKLQQTFYITIPAIAPLMVVLTILAVGRIFNSDFGLFYNVPLNMGTLTATTEVIDTYVFRIMQTADYGMATASGLYQAVVGFILVMTTNFIVKKINGEYSLF
jgi:putative aldouronate transport system permease protein